MYRHYTCIRYPDIILVYLGVCEHGGFNAPPRSLRDDQMDTYGGFHKWGYQDIPTMDGLMENPKAAYTVSTKYGFIQVGYISICHYVGICWLYLLSLFGFSPILQPVLWRALGSYSKDGRVLPGDGDDDGVVMLCFWTKETANASDANWHTWWFYPTYPTYN